MTPELIIDSFVGGGAEDRMEQGFLMAADSGMKGN